MGAFTVSFFGRKYVPDPNFIENEVSKIIKSLIGSKKQIRFLVGRNCDFDIIVSSVINKAEKETTHAEIAHACILTRPTETYIDDNNEFQYHFANIDIIYSSVEILATEIIQERNEKMVRQSDLCVFYAFEDDEIVFEAMQYAVSKNKSTINIADFESSYPHAISWTIS